MKKLIPAVIFILNLTCMAEAQPYQTIRGEVFDRDTKMPLIGVTVILAGSDPLTGTATNSNGEFILPGVPVGRRTIRFSYIGYETLYVREILVGSGKEVVLNIGLREITGGMDEVVVTPDERKDIAGNPMAAASARLLSVEEASRYAGGFDDPARLAASFAGVAGNLASNAIVIRGNSPNGLLWRMEGIEIPVPTHFANLLTFGGGGITALSSHLLADTDFFTGAFPAEFGNAISGVFDMRMRNGNNRNREQTVKLGVIGLDAAAEGPFSDGGAATYLFNYRYSTFSLLGPLLPEDADNIFYQNLAFKLNFSTGRSGSVSIWGIGANDRSGQSASADSDGWLYDQDREDLESPTRFGAIGAGISQVLGPKSYLTSTLAISGNGLNYKMDRYTDQGVLIPRERIRYISGKVALTSSLNSKFSASHAHITGFTTGRLFYDQFIRFAVTEESPLEPITDEKGHTWQLQGFTQSSYTIGRFTFLAGLHLHYLTLNGDLSPEPRTGITYRTSGRSSLHLAYGRHSGFEHLPLYFAHPDNRNLGFTKADHLVAGFRQLLADNLNLNIEVYYQHLRDVPVIPDSSFSAINLEQDWFLRYRMTNDGRGRNYGIDLTLERYFSSGWYALLSASVFDSEYSGGDRVWRDTRYNRNYTLVLLGGKEWFWQSDPRSKSFGINGRINMLGGRRYSPVDFVRTMDRREVFYDETRAFSQREPAVFYADLTLEYRVNRRSTAGVWSLQMINLTGFREFYGYRYNLRENRIDQHREAIILPNLSYRFEF